MVRNKVSNPRILGVAPVTSVVKLKLGFPLIFLGMIGLTENPSALLKWMLTAPTVAELTDKFESNVIWSEADSSNDLHHMDTPAARERFKMHTSALLNFFDRTGKDSFMK